MWLIVCGGGSLQPGKGVLPSRMLKAGREGHPVAGRDPSDINSEQKEAELKIKQNGNQHPTMIEIGLDDGSKLFLRWTRTGALSIQRFTLVKDQGYWLQASGELAGGELAWFMQTGAMIVASSNDITQKLEALSWLEPRN